jgi:hypothetical protein
MITAPREPPVKENVGVVRREELKEGKEGGRIFGKKKCL